MTELIQIIDKIRDELELGTKIDFFLKVNPYVNKIGEEKNFSLSGTIQSKGFCIKYTDIEQSEKFVNIEGSSWMQISESNVKELMVFLDRKINQENEKVN